MVSRCELLVRFHDNDKLANTCPSSKYFLPGTGWVNGLYFTSWVSHNKAESSERVYLPQLTG